MNRLNHTPLICHPATPCTAVEAIDITVERTAAGGLELCFRVLGAPAAILLPSPQPSGPADELWQHTCCEAFVSTVNQKNYQEFNFSPSGQWAAYRFTDYRERDTSFSPAGAPIVALELQPNGFLLKAGLAPALLPADQTLQLGITAVIEAADGRKSYWALQHSAPQPDFHLRPSFTLTLNRNPP